MKKPLILFLIGMFALGCASKKHTVAFEKLVFHTSRCFGECPIYHLQVNSDKTLFLVKEHSYRNAKQSSIAKDSVKGENFKGVVSDANFKILLKELAATDTITFKGRNCCDGSIKTIITHYNGKRKYIKTMFPPKEADKLIAVLYAICTDKNIVPTTEKFRIEEDRGK
jgi:hypothetical protein